MAMDAALEMGIPLSRGTYAGVLGPSYETPAEIRFFEGIGAHAVGMSTVPEAIVARALEMKVLAFSLITNQASGLGSGTLNHEEVLEMGRGSGSRLKQLIQAVLPRLHP